MIQELHRDWLDPIMVFFTTLGNAGLFWIALSVVLSCIPKTRKCGLTMLFGMALTYLFGNILLKNLVARPRPCAIDKSVTLLIPFPREYSFPSGHSSNGFTAAFILFGYYRKMGVAALAVAAIIAFSRMYLFVHYPTDILGGICVGLADAYLAFCCARKVWQREGG
ncbi:MAG: phosphatase PAP2 family protein [Candidatus Gastranaerophilales bacterium]|nr:phosphatase PAP2 family protein [Candidatus Gastranaerophilales bacterium]